MSKKNIIKREEINNIIRMYKNKKMDVNQCIHLISKKFSNLYYNRLSRIVSISKIDTGATYMPDFNSVYLDTIESAVRNFSFDVHHGYGTNNISFVGYFKNLFDLRINEYLKVIFKEIEKKKTQDSIEEILEDEEHYFNFEEKYMSTSFDKTANFNERNLQIFLKKNLSKRELDILDLKLKGQSDDLIACKYDGYCSREKIRREWCSIKDRLKILLEKRIKTL